MAVTYRCTISADGYSDSILPITSFQLRYRQSPLQNYLLVVVPRILTYADIINDRIEGEITLTHIEDETETDILADANINAFRTYIGPENRTGQIVAYKQITHPGTGVITISSPIYHSLSDGEIRFRAKPDPLLLPDDDAVVAGVGTITVTEISWNVGEGPPVMEAVGT